MSWKKNGNVQGIRTLGRRHHKTKSFTPVLKNIRTKERIYRYLTTTKIANKRYYRIYKHKGQGWTLYVGPPKESHGGIRTKPSRSKYTKKIEKQWRDEAGVVSSSSDIPRPQPKKAPPLIRAPTRREVESGRASPGFKAVKKLPERQILKVRKVKWGKHKGEYISQKGEYIQPRYLHLFISKNDKYHVIVKE